MSQDIIQQDAESSFDSSNYIDDLSLTQTTNSIQLQIPRGIAVEDEAFIFSPVLTPRGKAPPQQNGLFIGFRNAWGQKEIVINQSKMKKAKQFFDDSQIDANFDSFSVENTVNIPSKGEKNHYQQPQQYSMPCFKTVGSGAQVKISDNTRKQVTNLFKEFQSIKKPTKMKKNSKFITESMIKTHTFQSKIKPMTTETNRQSFNLQQYQRQYKKQLQQQIKQTKQSKRITQVKRKGSIEYIPLQFIFVRLFSLTISRHQQFTRSLQLSKQYQQIQNTTYKHSLEICKIIHCVLCKIKYQQERIDASSLYSIFNRQFAKKWITSEQFITYYHQVSFKLLKYSLFWPEVINKTYNLSNLLIEINKKSLVNEKQQGESSFLKYCLKKQQIGRRINLVVKRTVFNEKMKIVYILLSDGWATVWAAIQQKNLLFQYVKRREKLRAGTKLSLALWNFHPISNILQFCTEAKNREERCIEFFYNGSIILHANAKLGHCKEQFYRPLSKCRAKGGLLPVTQGTIIRMFTTKASKRTKNDIPSFSAHFAQLLTPEGFTCLIKFILNQQSSLVEYFRLYHYYRLYKLKINEENSLIFLMNHSKYQQIALYKISQRQQLYPKNVTQLLKKRYINAHKKDEWQNGSYDVLCSNGKVKMCCGKEYQVQMQGQSLSSSCAIYQQVEVAKVSEDCVRIRKKKESSQLRKIPKIYQSLQK